MKVICCAIESKHIPADVMSRDGSYMRLHRRKLRGFIVRCHLSYLPLPSGQARLVVVQHSTQEHYNGGASDFVCSTTMTSHLDRPVSAPALRRRREKRLPAAPASSSAWPVLRPREMKACTGDSRGTGIANSAIGAKLISSRPSIRSFQLR